MTKITKTRSGDEDEDGMVLGNEAPAAERPNNRSQLDSEADIKALSGEKVDAHKDKKQKVLNENQV